MAPGIYINIITNSINQSIKSFQSGAPMIKRDPLTTIIKQQSLFPGRGGKRQYCFILTFPFVTVGHSSSHQVLFKSSLHFHSIFIFIIGKVRASGPHMGPSTGRLMHSGGRAG
jgi:hypothetical protein